jgi:hypothetical protein
MKKYLLGFLATIVFDSAFTQTQLSNSGFENWTTDVSTSNEVPAAPWKVVTEYAEEPVYYITTGAKTTDAKSGSFALQLKPYTEEGSNPVILSIDGNYTNFSSRPASFEGFYKFAPVGGDAVKIIVQLIKTTSDPDAPEQVASGSIIISNVASAYTSFNVPITYFNTSIPDKVTVLFEMKNKQTTEGTVFTLDDLNFIYPSTVKKYEASLKMIHTSNGFARFYDETKKANWKVYDMSGKLLYIKEAVDHIDIKHLSSGMYAIEVLTEDENSLVLKVINGF